MSSSEVPAAPFVLGEADARAAALAWIRRRWFASPRLARHARAGLIDPAWIPFWWIDARAVMHWEGTGLRGIVEMDFGALPVCAEAAADAQLMEALEPWPALALRGGAGGEGGHAIVSPALSRDSALTLAHKRMERDLMATARRGQPAKLRERIRPSGFDVPREACELVLLPLWRFDDLRLGRRWRIAVNALTGKVAGRRIR